MVPDMPNNPDNDDAAITQRRRRRVRRVSEEAAPAPMPVPPPAQRSAPSPRRISAPRPARTTGGRGPVRPNPAQPPGAADVDAPTEEHVRWHHEAAHGETVSERGLRGLIGGGATQVNVTAAMRARDAARPREADLARAETDLTVVRRYWMPRETAVPQEGSGGSS